MAIKESAFGQGGLRPFIKFRGDPWQRLTLAVMTRNEYGCQGGATGKRSEMSACWSEHDQGDELGKWGDNGMESALHEAASHHLPPFITAPGHSDWLMTLMAFVLIGSVLAAGVFFFWLHSLPERMVHNKVQFDLVCVLALISLFTHIHAFWVAALIIALIEFPQFSLPDFSNSMKRIASSLETIADARTRPGGEKEVPPSAGPKPLLSTQSKADGLGSGTHANEPARKREAGHA